MISFPRSRSERVAFVISHSSILLERTGPVVKERFHRFRKLRKLSRSPTYRHYSPSAPPSPAPTSPPHPSSLNNVHSALRGNSENDRSCVPDSQERGRGTGLAGYVSGGREDGGVRADYGRIACRSSFSRWVPFLSPSFVLCLEVAGADGQGRQCREV